MFFSLMKTYSSHADLTNKEAGCSRKFKNQFIVEGPKWIWLAIWLCGVLYQWISSFQYSYARTGVIAIAIAKGCAGVINLNMGIMLLLVTKSVTTVLRRIYLAKLLPLNFNVYFHRLLGMTTLVCGFVHTISHISGSYKALSSFDDVKKLNKILFQPIQEVKSYTWWLFCSMPSLTGYFALVILILMVVFALKKNRRRNYERFWYSHQMWILVYILLSLHSSKEYIARRNFIYWTSLPSFILVFEKLTASLSLLRRRFKILDVTYINSDLIELKISKPTDYEFKAGQFALLNIKELSLLQWHPFSYSSAPSCDFLLFHISPVGDWTKQLKELAIKRNREKALLPKVSVMGPYGAPSQHYKDFKHIMIFCTGVGATPFASILRELVNRAIQQEDLQEYSIGFFWMCRNPSNHGWLSKLFADLQSQDKAKQIIDIHMFFTGPQNKNDLRMNLLWSGLNKIHEKGVFVKGLEHLNIMHWGRPDWDQVFLEKKREIKKGNVGVFFCGNTFLAKEINEKCHRHSKHVNFVFSKEIF